jgi:uncharacterized protein
VVRHALFAAVALFFTVCAAAAQTLSFPALTGRVVDDAGILDAATRAELTQTLAALEGKTTDQLVVVTLKSLQGTSIEDYGYQLGRAWKIGQKAKNNGILLIVVPGERRVRIEVGYGLEGMVTDAISKLIIEDSIIPRFKAGDYPGGIKRGVEDIVQVLTGDAAEWQQRAVQNVAPDTNQNGGGWPIAILVLAGVGLLIFCALVSGLVCQIIFQILFMMLSSGGGRGSRSGGSWSGGGGFGGGGGSFGGGGASGSW